MKGMSFFRNPTLNPFKRLLPIGIVLLAVMVVGVTGFMAIEHWTPLESIYMVVITLLTIGFQEVHPLSPQGRIFTMIIAILGVGTAVYAAGQAAETIVEGEIFGYRTRRKMEKKIKELHDHYIISGFGRVGHQVAEDFDGARIPYLVIDAKPETASELQPKGVPHIVGDPTLDEVLEEAGIHRAKGLVACSDSDVSNVYVTLSARALNARLYIVARASQRETEKKLKMAGADRVISPYYISGRRMAALVTRPVTSDFLDTVSHGGELEFRLHEIQVPSHSSLVDRTLAQSLIRTKCGAVVLAIHKAGGTFELQPQATSVIRQGDTLVVIGTSGQIESLVRMMG
jgi:voltage-gated potassium channel